MAYWVGGGIGGFEGEIMSAPDRGSLNPEHPDLWLRKSGPSRRLAAVAIPPGLLSGSSLRGETSRFPELIQRRRLGRRRRHLVRIRNLAPIGRCRSCSRRGSSPIGAEKANLAPGLDSVRQGRIRIMSDALGTARVKDTSGRGQLR